LFHSASVQRSLLEERGNPEKSYASLTRLLRGGLLQIVETTQLHLLAHFIEPLDDFRIRADFELFAFIQQKLAIDQPAERVFLRLLAILCAPRRILVLAIVFELLLFVLIFGTGNDLIIDSGDDFLDHGIGEQSGGN